jgi:hypothetical protein
MAKAPHRTHCQKVREDEEGGKERKGRRARGREAGKVREDGEGGKERKGDRGWPGEEKLGKEKMLSEGERTIS